MTKKADIKYKIRMELNFLSNTEKREILAECLKEVNNNSSPISKHNKFNYELPAYKRGFGNVKETKIFIKGVKHGITKSIGVKKAHGKKAVKTLKAGQGLFVGKTK